MIRRIADWLRERRIERKPKSALARMERARGLRA